MPPKMLNPGALAGPTGARKKSIVSEPSTVPQVLQLPTRTPKPFLDQWTARLPTGGFIGAYRAGNAIWSGVVVPGDSNVYVRTHASFDAALRCAQYVLAVAEGRR